MPKLSTRRLERAEKISRAWENGTPEAVLKQLCTVTLGVSEEQLERANTVACNNGLSLSELCTQALLDIIEPNRGEK